MAKCEHCSVDPAEIRAEVQAGADRRIKELTDRAKLQAEELRKISERANAAEGALKTLQAEREAGMLEAAEREAGWKLDERGRKAARWAYEDALEGMAEDQRPSFADWLKSEAAAKDPLLSSYRAPTTPPPAPGAPKPPTPAPQRTPDAPPAALTLEQRNARAKEIAAGPGSPADKLAALAALKAQTPTPTA